MSAPLVLPAVRFHRLYVVDAEFGCWDWQGIRPYGYGRFWSGGTHGKNVPAHRFAYELLVGPVPEGLVLDHLCRNRGCVNPAHLESVTQRVNILRGEGLAAINALKTHCDRGHEFDEQNTYVYKDGRRTCRKCIRDRARVRMRTKRRLAKAVGA